PRPPLDRHEARGADDDAVAVFHHEREGGLLFLVREGAADVRAHPLEVRGDEGERERRAAFVGGGEERGRVIDAERLEANVTTGKDNRGEAHATRMAPGPAPWKGPVSTNPMDQPTKA